MNDGKIEAILQERGERYGDFERQALIAQKLKDAIASTVPQVAKFQAFH